MWPTDRLRALAAAAAVTFPIAALPIAGSWRLHTSFDRQTAYITDSPRYVWMLVHQAYFRKDMQGDISSPTPALLMYDTRSENGRLEEPRIPGCDSRPVAVRYSPARALTVVLHEDRTLSLLPDEGEPVTVSDLRFRNVPGSSSVRSVNVSPADGIITIAADFGFATLRPGALSMDFTETGTAVDFALFCGSRILTLSDGHIMEAAAGIVSDSQSWKSPEISSGQTLPAYVRGIFPLSDSSFMALMSASASDRQTDIYVMTLSDYGVWNASRAASGRVTHDANTMLLNPLETSVRLAPAGYTVLTTDSMHLIAADNETGTERFIHRSAPLPSSGMQAASYNLDRLWYPSGRDGFVEMSRSGDEQSQWTATSPAVRPSGPACLLSTSIGYAEGFGLVAADHGLDQNFRNSSGNVPPLISVLSNGQWTIASPAYTLPGNVDSSDPRLRLSESYPLCHPNGLTPAPDEPGILFSGSPLGGIARFDLNNPLRPVLHLGNAKDPCAAVPGFVDFAPVQKAWNRIAKFSAPLFDADGNLWSAFYDLDAQNAGDNHADLWVWPKESRLRASEAIDNPDAFEPWLRLRFPLERKNSNYEMLLPLCHEGNTTRVLYTGNDFHPDLVIIDHNGTLADSSDDTAEVITDRLPFAPEYFYSIWENPRDGTVWAGTDSGVIRIAISDDGTAESSLPIVRATGGMPERFLEGIKVNVICGGPEGSIWFGTEGAGLWCLSADGTDVEANFNTDNSPLLSDDVYGIGFNPAEGNLLVSTARGFAEFIADGASPSWTAESNVSVTPGVVRPDFNGKVRITGIPAGCSNIRIVCGATAVATIPNTSAAIEWDPAACAPLGAGLYNVTDAETGTVLSNIRVLAR